MSDLRHLLVVLFLCCVTPFAFAEDYGFSVSQADIERVRDRYFLDAEVQYDLSEEVKEALTHGVPLTIQVHVMVYRQREYFWDEVISDIQLSFRVRYHALAKLYQIDNESSGVRRNFSSLDAALASLGKIRHMPLIHADKIKRDRRYIASLMVDLDLEALPLPLRPLAYLSPQWYLGSDWYSWPLKK